jgi:tetratricopeptide (TPR) repeat protein
VTNLTLSGAMIGTARYMSPEQAAGRIHEVDHRSDIYSLGITLYELLTLQPAFDGSTRQELLRAVESDRPEPLRRLNSSVPLDLETIVMKAIEKERDDRYRSAGELAEDLEHFLEGRPTIAKRPGVKEHAYRWISRHQKTVLATTMTLLLALVWVGGSAAMIHSQRKQTEAEAARAALYLRESQRVVDNFGAMVDQRLEHLPGSSSLRRELLGELEKYYSAYLRQAGEDTSLAVDLATTQFRLAAVHQRMGDFDRATAGYQKALAGFEKLLRQSPDDLDRLADVAICHNNIGQVAAKLGDDDLSRRHYESAISNYTQLADSGHEQGQNGLARSQMNLGLLLSASGDPDALAVLGGAFNALRTLARQTPDDLDLLDQLALCENNLAALAMKSDLDRAESLLRNAVARYQMLQLARPASPEHLADQALAGGNLAAVLAHRGQSAESLSTLGDVVRIRDMLVKLEPGVLSHRHDLAIAHQQLGQLQISSNEFAAAKEHYAESQRVLKSVVADSPKDHQILSSLGRTVSNLGMIEARLGNHQGAIASLEQAAEYQQQAVDLMPANLHYKQLLEHHRERILEIRTPPPPNSSGLTINDSGGR